MKIEKTDLMATEETVGGGLFSAKKSMAQLNRIFVLGVRDQVLSQIDKVCLHVLIRSAKQAQRCCL